jgi:hypothetical protein
MTILQPFAAFQNRHLCSVSWQDPAPTWMSRRRDTAHLVIWAYTDRKCKHRKHLIPTPTQFNLHTRTCVAAVCSLSILICIILYYYIDLHQVMKEAVRSKFTSVQKVIGVQQDSARPYRHNMWCSGHVAAHVKTTTTAPQSLHDVSKNETP